MLLACAELAIFMLALDPSVRDVFDLTKATFTHSLAWVLLGVVVIIGLTDGIRIPASPLFITFYLVVAAEILTAITATNRYVAIYGEVGRYLGLTTHLVLALVAVAIGISTDYPRRARWLAVTVGGAAALAGGYAIVQAAGGDPIRWADPAYARLRPFATFGNPDFYGQFLSVVVVGCAAVVTFGGSGLGWLRWAVLALGLSSTGLMVVVATRGSLVGLIAGAVVLALLWLRRAGATRRAVSRLALASAGFAMAFGLVVVATPIGTRLIETASGVGLRDRVLLYQAAATMFFRNPLVGVGFENFAVVYPQYQQGESRGVSGRNTTNTSSHNWILHLAATTGAVGLLTTFALLIAVLVHTWRRARDADASALLVATTGMAAFYGSGLVLPGAQSIQWIPWACIGVALASDLRTARVALAIPRLRPPALAKIVLLVGLASLTLLQLTSLNANRFAKAAESAIGAGAGARAVDAARRATALDAGRATYWNDLGRALELVDDQAGARSAYREATSRSPYTPAFWWNLGRMHLFFALQGDEASRAPVYEAMRQALLAAPQNPDTFDQFARAQLALGDFAGALANEERAIELYPQDERFYTVAADAARRLKEGARSVDLLRQGVAATGSNELRLTLARRLIEGGSIAEARSVLNDVLKKDATNATALDLLKQVDAR